MNRIDSIRTLVAAATPGPWATAGAEFRQVVSPTEPVARFTVSDDAAFIAASRTAVPLLLAAIDEALEHVPQVWQGILDPDIAWLGCSCGWDSDVGKKDWHGHIAALAPLLEPVPA